MLNITTTRGLSRSAKDRRIDGLIPAPSSRPSLCLEKRRWIQSIMIIYLLVLLALFKFVFVLNFVSVKNKNKIKISVRSLKIPWRASPSGPASAHRENIPGKHSLNFGKLTSMRREWTLLLFLKDCPWLALLLKAAGACLGGFHGLGVVWFAALFYAGETVFFVYLSSLHNYKNNDFCFRIKHKSLKSENIWGNNYISFSETCFVWVLNGSIILQL